jgi:molecular chaperone GrpE
MSDQAGQAQQGSDQAEAAEPESREVSTEREGQAAAQAEALAKMEDQWRRALADADNVRKRAVRDGAQQRAQERAAVALAWLPILDNLELALAHAPNNGDPLVEGIAAIRAQAMTPWLAWATPESTPRTSPSIRGFTRLSAWRKLTKFPPGRC